MNSGSRIPYRVALSLIVFLALGGSVLAADYGLEVGVDTRVGKDTTAVQCSFDETCVAKLGPFGLKITTWISGRYRVPFASVSIYGDEFGCCYFEGATPSTVIDAGRTTSQLPIFRGREARGAVFIENEHVGVLYLRFQLR